MCGIITICNYSKHLLDYDEKIMTMTKLLQKRGPDHMGYFMTPHCLMGHTRLAIIDLKNGQQPLLYTHHERTYRMTYNGEIYNMNEIKNHLIELGYTFQTMSDSEVVLAAYIEYQEHCLDLFEGIFAFVIDDGEKLFAARDPLGVKPLYYTLHEGTLVIASEIKSLLSYLGQAIVDEKGVKELLGLGPSLTPGQTVYKNIYSLRPGYYLYFQKELHIQCYWKLHDQSHDENLPETIQHVRHLVIESVQHQLLSDVPLSTMLSGGLDSSIITAITSQYVRPLSTYSVTYEDQEQYFHAYDYQTTMDDDYIHQMVTRYTPHHHNIILKQTDLIDALKEALIARDMPGMADIDASFLLFSKEIAKEHKVTLSGECADEIFGGYPWFYKEELYNQPYFPWMRDLDQRLSMFNEKVQKLNLKDYIIQRYQESLQEIHTDNRKKQLIYLNTQWFMQTLLTRADSQTMRASLEVRVPFASTKILQYLYNMPEDYMFFQGEEKGILRQAFHDFLPEDILHRKKNPYPKTYSPLYAQLIENKLKESLKDPSNLLFQFFDYQKLNGFIQSHGQSLTAPWFGQLMMGPQLMAYFYQIYLWGKIYHIQLEF